MPTPSFVDVGYAAEHLHLSPDLILGWVDAGTLRTFGGKASNPFVRLPEVTALAEEMGVLALPDEPPKRAKSAGARVQVRLNADARWADVAQHDIVEWVRRAEPARRNAARTAVLAARERLDWLLQALDEAAG